MYQTLTLSDAEKITPCDGVIISEWRPVYDPPDSGYEISDAGGLRRNGRLLNPALDSAGYPKADLFVNGSKYPRCIHRLVAEAFIGPRPGKATVNHRDCDKTNNQVGNLEYLSRGDNVRHGFANGQYPMGENHPQAKLTAVQVKEIRALLPIQNNCRIARRFGVSDVAIRKIRLGVTWKDN